MRKLALLLTVLLFLTFTGCSPEHEETGGPVAYAWYLSPGAQVWGDWLAREETDLELSQEPEAFMTALVEVMRTPKNPTYLSLLEDYVQLEQVKLEDSILALQFDDGLRRMEKYRRLMLCAALSRAAGQCTGVTGIRVLDSSGLISVEMDLDEALTDPGALGVRALELTLFLHSPGASTLDQVKRTVYTDREYLTLEQTLDLLLSLHGTTGLHAPFDGMVMGYSVDTSEGICRIDLQIAPGVSGYDVLDIYGLVNSLAGVEGETRFLVSVNGAAPSAIDIPDCDGILFYNTEYIR